MPWMAAASVAAPAVGSLIGGLIGGGKQDDAAAEAKRLSQQAMELYNGVIPPQVKNLIVEQLTQQGLYTPETADAVELGISQVSGIQEDASLREARKAALSQMGQISRTGFGAQDRAALNKVKNELASSQAAKQAQIQQQMAARGLGGSGSELAMAIANSQAGAQAASEEGDRIAADASNRALTALSNYGNMAGDLRGQDFDVNRAKASAADEFQRFNVNNKQDVSNLNVGNRNKAQQANLEVQQRIADANIANRRQEAVRQEDAKQSRFTNEMNLADKKASILTGQANMAMNEGKRKAEGAQSIGTGIGGIAGGLLSKFAPAASAVVPGVSPVDENTDVGSYLSKGSSLLGK